MLHDSSELNTQHYKGTDQGLVKQSRKKKIKPPPLQFCVVAIEKGVFGSPSTTVGQFTHTTYVQHPDENKFRSWSCNNFYTKNKEIKIVLKSQMNESVNIMI